MTTVSKNFREPIPKSSIENFRWYWDAISSGFDYVVAMTRRCPNWMEACLLKEQGGRAAFSGMLTESGLLMECENIAEWYLKTGRFPSIALLDDILVHGRSMNEFLRCLLDLLTECLRRRGYEANGERLQRELCRSLSLFVLVVNDAPILLKQEYQWGMHFRYVGRELEWRNFSFDTSKFIWNAEVANTSYVVSARQPDQGAVNGPAFWETVMEDEIPYRNARQRFYVHPISHTRRAFPTVRSYRCSNFRYYTPCFFCGSLFQGQIDRALKLIYSCVPGGTLYEDFFRLLDRARAYPQRRSVYFQLVNFLLGQITLSCFFDEAGLFQDDFELDTDKIARNFGLPSQVEPCLKALCDVHWPVDLVERICDVMDLEHMEPWAMESTTSADNIRSIMELAVYLQAMHHEEYAKSLEREFAAGHETDKIKPTGERTLEHFFSIVYSGMSIPKREYRTTVLMLACLTQMMDWGDVSLKARHRVENGEVWYASSIRNTEMSLSILPRKLGTYFPYFFRLAQLSWRDSDFPMQVRNHFKRLLPDRSAQSNELICTAEIFAQIISDNQGMVGTLINWKDVPLDDTQAE